MRDLTLYELNCVSAAGEGTRVIGCMVFGIMNGILSDEGFQDSNSSQEYCMNMVLNAAKAATGALFVSQIMTYESDYSSMYHEKYRDRERILLV